jgi:hypothetical protein
MNQPCMIRHLRTEPRVAATAIESSSEMKPRMVSPTAPCGSAYSTPSSPAQIHSR